MPQYEVEHDTLNSNKPRQTASTPARNAIPWILILIVWMSVYLQGAFRPSLLDDADSTHAEAAREMYESRDYVTLHVNGIRYLEKAPLPYWLVAFGFSAFGVSEFAVRLPIILSILLMIGLGALWGLRAFGRRGGIYAGLFVATCIGCFLFTRIFIPDVILSLLIALSLYFFLSALQSSRQREWRWYAAYALIALAVLTKGLVAAVFIVIPAIGYLALTGEWRRWRELRLGKGILIFILVCAPWHILAGVRNHGFFWFYFVNEQFLRFLGERYPHDYNKLPPVLYWGLHLVWLFPWSLYFPLIFRDLKRDIAAARNPSALNFAIRTRALCWVWAGVVLVFFSFSTNQEYYTFPAYLPLLLLIAGSLARDEKQKRSSRWTVVGNGLYAAAGLAAGAVLVAALWASRNVPPAADLGELLVHREVANNTLSMSKFFDLTTSAFAALRLPAGLAAAALLIGPLAALLLRLRRKHLAATWATGLATAVFLIAAQLAFVRFGPFLSSSRLADAIRSREKPGDMVMIYGDQAYGSSLLFYLKRPIDLVNGRTTSMWFGSTFPDAPHIFLDDGELARDWGGEHRIFLFVPPGQLDTVNQVLPQPRYVVAESSGKIVYSNQR
ncbi:MAG TPA: glycosyltransferase family 39 protein [Terriglobia bacterium]|nr:glycosyltransferase family 39 protein [Terriglobia bacterium]